MSCRDGLPVSEVHKVVGDLIGALQYIKSKGMFHLNLKPTNVFLHSGSYVIADFGLPALMSDIATRTRTTDGILYKFTELEYLYRVVREPRNLHSYHPPELKASEGSKLYDSKADVYSLGLMIYQMVFAELEIPEDINEWRDRADNIEDDILRGLFLKATDPTYETRPHIDDLVELPEVKHLMEIAERERISTKRQKSASVPHKIVPVDSPIEVVIDNLNSAIKSEELTRASFRAIFAVTARSNVILEDSQKHVVLEAARFHEEVQDIQEKFLAIAYNIIPTIEEEIDTFSSVSLCQHIQNVLKRYPNHENIVYACLQVVLLISAHRPGARHLCKSKMLRVLADLTEKYPSNDKTVAMRLVLWVFWGVSAFKENLKDLMREQIAQWIYGVADTAQKEEVLLEPFTACMWTLSNYKENIEDFKRIFGVDLLLHIVHDHQNEPRILRNCCMALANSVEADEVCAYSVLASKIDDPFIVLRSIYKPNRDNPEFVEAYVTLLAELSNYDEIRYELHRLNFVEVCREIELFYSASEQIVRSAEKATANLKAYKLEI